MKSYVSSFSGSWFQRCLSMVLCFCMVLSLCPLPQHAAASEVEEGQEVSQPVETQPAPQPVETQPAPQPVETQPAPQPVETQPAPQPVETQPAPQPVETQPAPQPVETQPAPQPVETQPAPQPVETQPAPQPVETQPAPQPVETQPAPQPEETQPVTQPEETQPVTQPVETQPVTQPEETQPVTQPEETQEVTQPVETQEVTEPEETQEVTEPEETQETTEPEETQEEQPLVVTAWQWNDEWEALDEETGILGVSFASIENPVYLWSILEVLPAEIFATVDGEVVTLTLGEWKCDDYPTAGAYQGEYVFKTTLPEGYVLAEDAAALEVPVVFYSDASTLEEEHTHSFDVNGVCSCGAMQVRYLDASHAVQTAVCQAVTAETTELTDGWYVAQGNVTIGGSVTATGNANLILADGCSLTVGGDFLIQGGKSLNIYVQSGGTGSLTISGSTGLDISGSGDVSVGIYGGRIVVNASIGSSEGRTTLSSSAGSSAVIYCGGFGYQVDRSGFHGVFVSPAEYGEIWVAGSSAPCCDIVIPQGSEYYMYFEGDASLSFTNGRMLQVPDGSSLQLSGTCSFPNGIAANVDLRTILSYGYAFQNSSGIIKLSGETSLPGPITLVDKHYCSWQYKDSTAEGHTRYCDECGRSFTEAHAGDMEQGMVTTDDTHSYTCDCGAEVTEAHTWEYWYDGADSHSKRCTGCGYYVEDIPHDFTSGDCVCGAVQVSYSDTTGTQQGTAVCTPLNSLDEEELNEALYEGWYLIEGNTVLDSLHNFNDVNLVLANGCCLQISSYHNAGRSVTIWQQPAEEGKATGKLVISGSNYAIYGSGVTIKGGVLELSGTEHAFEYAPTLGSGMKLSVSDGNGGYTPVNFADRTSTLSSAKELKLEPCTDHVWGSADNEYIDSSYHGVRCQYCGIGGDRKEAHSFDANGFCDCGAVQFLDASGNQAVQYCQVLSGETTYTDNISSGWYVVKGVFDFQGTMSGTVNLVLANGSKLYNSGDAWGHKIQLDENANLTVYAQSKDPSVMGKLVSTYTSQYGLRASSITFNGGNIYVEGMDWAVSGRFTVNGGIVELRATNDIGDVSYGMPSVPVGMRITIVKDEGNVLVTDREGDWSKQQHVIIQPCTDHSVTKGSTYIDDSTHTLMCAYCDVLLEGTGEHDFGTNGVCNCGLVQYLDENGETQTQLCQKFTGGMENGGWYVLDKDYSGWGFWTEKDANLILAKGVTLNSDGTLHGCTLTVYGQPGSVLNLGNLDTEGGSLSILGGVTQIGTVNNYQPLTLTVNGGILSVDTIEYDDEPVTVNNQRGIYLQGGVGQVAGDFTLGQSFTLEDGQILTIPEGAKLTTGGYLTNGGKIYVDGELTDWYICTGEVYYPVKLPEGVTAQIKTDEGTMENLRENDGKLYAKAEQEIVLTNNGEGTILVNENIYENSFFMPSRTVTVKTHKFDSDGFCTECDAYQPATKNNGKYEIGNAGQLFWFAALVNGTLNGELAFTIPDGVLTADIVIPDGKTWTPIGSDMMRYQGTFDGADYTISNLCIEAPEGFSIGLFGASTGTIKNLTVKDVSCGSVSNNFAGGICGRNYGTIKSCFADSVAWTNVGNMFIGSVCGYNGRAMGRIMDCRSANSTMQKTAASAAAEELPLCGYNANSISGCTSDSGICLISDDGTISDCLSSGSYLCQNLRDGTIKDCYTTGSAFVLSKEGGTIDNCYYQAASETFNDNGSVGKTTAQFASGEVAYLLNDGRTGNLCTWGQYLSGVGKQDYPELFGDYPVTTKTTTTCDGSSTETTYINGEEAVTATKHVSVDNATGYCAACGQTFIAKVTRRNEETYYKEGELDNAFNANGDGTLTLYQNAAISSGIDYKGVFTLELNSHTLTLNGTNNNFYDPICVHGGTLIIADDAKLNSYTSKGQSSRLTLNDCTVSGEIYVTGYLIIEEGVTLKDATLAGTGEQGSNSRTSLANGTVLINTSVATSYAAERYTSLADLLSKDESGAFTQWFFTDEAMTKPLSLTDAEKTSYTGTLYVGAHTHTTTYTDNGDGTHTTGCYCGANAVTEDHEPDSDGFCTGCDSYEKPDQDENGVYLIDNAGKLFWFADFCNNNDAPRSARLLNDITIPKKADGSTRQWTPIGTYGLPYTGSFDGQGYTISGLYFNDSAVDYVGLFGYAKIVGSGIIQNVTVEGSFTGGYRVGGICGYLESGTIHNCQNLASVKAVQALGGICGKSEGTIEFCHNSGTITASPEYNYYNALAGGICGFLYYGATIRYCTNSGVVTGTGTSVGGIAGSSVSDWTGELTDCWNSGSIGGDNVKWVGGVIGAQNSSSGTVKNCYSYGTVSALYNGGPICSPDSIGTINNCFYLESLGTDSFDGTTAKTAEEFASGEVAYLLNANRTPAVWGQNLAEDSADAYPVLNGEPVAQVKDCAGTVKSYTNADSDVTLPHEVDETGKCSICNTQFVASATINGETSYYETFLEASTQVYLSGNGTLTLLAEEVNTAVPSGSLIISGTFNLDLNGKTLNVNTSVYVENSEVQNGEAELNVLGGAGSKLILAEGEKLYVESGKANIQSGEITGDIRADGGALTITGGKFTGKIEAYNSATYSITGGEFVNLSNVPGSASSNMQLYQLPAEGYWFYSTRNVDEEGNYTYSDPVQFGDITSFEYSYNGSLYVGRHSHEIVFTTIDKLDHNGSCQGCGKTYFDHHSGLADGFCDICGAGEVSYVDAQGVSHSAMCFPVTEDTKELTASPLSWYVVKDDVTINRPMDSGRVTVNGTVNLILMDGKDLTVNGGIEVDKNKSLTIWGQTNGSGSLTCQNCNSDAGIGGTKNGACGTVIINGGNITTTGGGNSAGIGGSGDDGRGFVDGTIQINGGTVKTTGGSFAPGIGGGRGRDAGTIVIMGGTVTATGNNGAPGIGGGLKSGYVNAKQDGDGGNVSISNATVIANGIGGPGGNGNLTISSNSVVISNYIKDQTQIGNWNGIVFIANEGKVYGNVTLSSDLVIPAGKNMTLDMNGNSLTLDGAKINLGENSSLKLSGNGSFPNGVSVTGGYLLDILADGWAFFYDIEGNDIVSLSSDTRFIVGDPSEPTVYLRPHVHSWVITGFDQYSHAKTCTCMTGSVEENHTEGDFCDICGAGMVSYLDAKGNDMGQQLCIPVTNASTELGKAGEETWYVVKDNLEASYRIKLSGDVNLILADGCLLNATKGIHVPEGSSLTIWCQSGKTGALAATGADGAGIGGNENNYKPDVDSTTGSITINGGNITAYGGWGDAAIGGAFNGSSGSVTINGGSVNAFGGGPAAETNRWGGAGIGGGLYCGAGTIQINGGTVYAVGAEAAAGIGGGGSGYGGSVEITGGHVTAIGGSENTSYSFGLNGIGSGGSDDIPVTIKGGTVICVAGNTTEGYAGKAYKSAPTIDSGYGSYKVTVAGTLEGLADGSPVDCASRTGAFTGNAAVKLEPCKSHSRSCEDKEDGIQHVHLCQYCGKIEGTEKHTAPDENGMCPDCGVKILAAVEEDGGSTGYYSEFLPAFSAANGLEGSTLKLLADVYAKNMLEVSGSFTLDLNGKTLTSDYFEYGDQDGAIWDDNGAICVPYDCSLTIQDSSEDKTGGIFMNPNPDLDDDHKNALAVKGGTLNFSGGSVNYRIRNEMGTLNISGSAKVEVGKDDTAVINVQPYYPTQKSRTVISGGTLIGGTCINAEGDTEVEITGGTFKALAGNSDDYSSCVNCVAGGSVTVSGGTFMKEQGDNVYTFMGNNISVSGGEFSGGISVVSGNLKDRLATDENGEIAYWYYQKLEDGVYSDGITAADAAAASYGSTVYVGRHEHVYSSEDGTCVCGKQVPVAVSIGGETQFFDSLSDAMASLELSAEQKAQVTVFQSTSFQNVLVIPENVTLTVEEGATLTAENNAILYVRSSLSGSVSGDVRYLVSVNTNEVNVTGRSVTVYLGSVYARADDPINLEAINYDADSMMLTDWLVNNESSSESFTMPSHPVTIERKLEAIVATVTVTSDGETTPYTNLYDAFDAANETYDNVIIELKADVVLGNDSPAMLTGGDVIFRGWEHTISGNEPDPDWENRNGYIAVRGGTNLTIESGTIASSAFLYCVPGSIVTVKNGSIDTLIVEGGKLTVEPAVDEENNPVGNIRVENLEVRGFSVGDVQLNGGSYGSITVPEDNDVSDLLADGYAYKLTDGSWEDANNGIYTEAISAATVLPVPVKIITEPQDKNITYGDNESLTVTANCEEASYQWYEVIPDPSETPQTKAITGETGSTLKLSTFNAGTHEFFCEATVDGYNAKSSSATVTVNPRTLDIQWDDWDDDTFEYDGQYHPKFTIGNTANGDQVFPVLQSGNEPQKNVGSYTVGVIDFVANGTDGFSKHGNYKLGATYRDFSITAKPITVNITANGGTYGEPFDGATAELVGVVAGETVPVTLTYTSASGYNSTTVPTDAGTYKVKASINNGNYELTGVKEAEFVVNKATNSWTTEPTVSNWTYGDNRTEDKGAAKYGEVVISYISENGHNLHEPPTDAGVYGVFFTVKETSNYTGLQKAFTISIEKRPLSIASAEGYERSYDGTNEFRVHDFTYENMIAGDQVHIGTPDTGHLATVSSANVGTYDKAALPAGLTLTGTDAGNYSLVQPTGPVATVMTINPREVTFSGITPYDKDYDGTKDVTNLEYSGLQISGLVTGDDLSVSVTAAFTDANAGQNKTVAFTNPVLTGNSAGNYVLKETGNQTSTTATIYPLEISIVDVTVEGKVYNGTKDATITNFGRLSTNYDGENLTIVPGTASFETANAGNGKTVSFQGFELSGSAKDNYKLIGQPASTTANITPATVAALTLKASSATYTGSAQEPEINTVTSVNDLTLTGSDYQVSYQDADGNTVTELRNAGTYTVTVTGNGNFQGEATASYTIAKAKPTVTPATLTIAYGTKLSGCDLSGFKASFGGKELPGSFAFDQPDTMPHVSDSGTTSYKLTFTPDDTVNFEKVQLETKITVNQKELTVNVAVQDKQYNGTREAFFDGTPALVGVVTGDKVELTYGDPYFTDVAEGEDIAISFTEAFAITGDDSGNYYLTQPTGITASIYNSFTAVKGEDGSYTVSTNEWTNQDFVVTAQEGFQLSLTNNATGEWSDTLTVTTEGEADLKFYVRSADGAISNQASEHYKLDKTAPTGSIFFDETDQTAGTTPVVLYRNAAVNAGITGSDDRSGVKDLAWAAFKQAQDPSSITDWNTAASFQLTTEDGTERHVYLKVVDNAGNVAYFRANTILFDTTKPSITGVDGVEKGTTYYTTQTAAVSDDYLDAVTLNGAAVTLNEDGKTASVKLTGNVDKTYSIKATDKAGNETTVTVIMKPISAITDPFKNLTGENITEDDRKSLEDTKDILEDLTDIQEDLLKNTTDEAEKQKLQDELDELQDELDKLQKLLDVLDKVKEVEELLRDLPDDVEPDVDADTEQKIKDARKALDDLTGHQEDLVEDDLIEKLERLEDELVDYKFLEGDGSTWNRGSGKAARFVGNGRLDKLDKVILDGTELTTGFTKNTPKTTIDLQAAFLQSLELGEHTLKLVYTDGEAEAKFTVKQSPNYLDLTGNPDFDDQTEVDVGGEHYPIEEIGGRYVNLPESGDLLTTYTYLAGNAAGTHDNYPIGMRVFRINRSEDGTTVTEITEFADLLQYSGCSIRVSGKRGIRMITSMTKSNKAALKGKGLAGFTMLEYGTVVQWADTLGGDDLTLNSGNHNYAYKRGVADPVFGTSGSLTQYTNVLVGFDLEECSKDIVMRPYIILQDAEGNQYTLYGGLVTRSISYIAWQNRDTYKPGTAAYKYVHELMGDLDTPAEGG